MKLSLIVLLSVLATTAAFASTTETNIYGWDISCVGANGEKVKASQSDDDFYIDYEGGKLKKGEVWADTMEQWKSELKILVFMTNQGVSKGPEAALTVVRQNTKGEGFADGVFLLDGERREMHCFVRYGKDEDQFDDIKLKAFPFIKPPKAK